MRRQHAHHTKPPPPRQARDGATTPSRGAASPCPLDKRTLISLDHRNAVFRLNQAGAAGLGRITACNLNSVHPVRPSRSRAPTVPTITGNVTVCRKKRGSDRTIQPRGPFFLHCVRQIGSPGLDPRRSCLASSLAGSLGAGLRNVGGIPSRPAGWRRPRSGSRDNSLSVC
jgi:hypothetical protein